MYIDMLEVERSVRSIEADGLLWGASMCYVMYVPYALCYVVAGILAKLLSHSLY